MKLLFENWRKFQNLSEAVDPGDAEVDKELERTKQQIRDEIKAGKLSVDLEGPFGDVMNVKDDPEKLGFKKWVEQGRQGVDVRVFWAKGRYDVDPGFHPDVIDRFAVTVKPGIYRGENIYDPDGVKKSLNDLVDALEHMSRRMKDMSDRNIRLHPEYWPSRIFVGGSGALQSGERLLKRWGNENMVRQLQKQAYIFLEIERQTGEMLEKLQKEVHPEGFLGPGKYYDYEDQNRHNRPREELKKKIADLHRLRSRVLNQSPDPKRLFKLASDYHSLSVKVRLEKFRALLAQADLHKTGLADDPLASAFFPDEGRFWPTIGDDIDIKRFMKRLEDTHLDSVVRKIKADPVRAMELELVDPLIREAKKTDWDKLSALKKKYVIDRLVSLQLIRDLNLAGAKRPIVKNINALDSFVSAWRDIESGIDYIDTTSRQLVLAGTKKPDEKWFKNFLKNIPFFGAAFAVVLFPYDEAQAAWNRGLLREQGASPPWGGPEGDTSIAKGLQYTGLQLFKNDPQAEFKSLLMLEMFRAVDPGVELAELLGALVMWMGDKAGESSKAVIKWLLNAPKRPNTPSPEDLEDYPELGEPPSWAHGDPGGEEIGPVPDD
mgnify:CR=1 FL=1